jgi:hypothetical protein
MHFLYLARRPARASSESFTDRHQHPVNDAPQVKSLPQASQAHG